jgi:hypothetical protein
MVIGTCTTSYVIKLNKRIAAVIRTIAARNVWVIIQFHIGLRVPWFQAKYLWALHLRLELGAVGILQHPTLHAVAAEAGNRWWTTYQFPAKKKWSQKAIDRCYYLLHLGVGDEGLGDALEAVVIASACLVKTPSDSSFLTFFDEGNILISEDNNYTQPLQQRNVLITLRMHTAKKEKKKTKK